MNVKESSGISAPENIIEQAETKTLAWAAYYELTKPRLSLLSVITALVGYLAALPERNLSILFNFICGTALCAASAAALNQWLEREEDAIMPRTRNRPLPTNQIQPSAALGFGLILGLVGTLQLVYGANLLAGIIGAATILSYIAIYTPMKKLTRWSTEVGAISGALPPLIGWTAATGNISGLGWVLFGILAFWQIPHFMAIAWSFRKDYAMAGFPMLSVKDPDGGKVARWSLINTVALIVVSILPSIFGYTSWIYGVVATIFGLWFLKRAIDFLSKPSREIAARKLFFCSIFYLPAVLFTLVIDRWILL